MDLINNFLKTEISFIIFIQNKFFHHEEILGHFSTFFNATFLYLYIIPILAAFNTKMYHRVLLSCVTCDFLNLILKWIISEDRPYWWVHETNSYTSLTRPTLYQTERTCETNKSNVICRKVSFDFIRDFVVAKIKNEPFKKHTFYEMVRGPREPSADTKMNLRVLKEL